MLPVELRERALWRALDFSRREIREYRWDFIEWNAAEFAFDGYELDFTRFIWNFPLEEERTHVHEMTEFVGDVRERLKAIGGRRGRGYVFAVHVMDSPALSLELGQDVDAWLAEGLVGALVVGMGYLPYELRLDRRLELGRRYGVPVYPSVNISTFCYWATDVLGRESAEAEAEAEAEAIKASSAYYWQEGTDGLYFFNWFVACEDPQFGLPFDAAYAPLREIGGPDALVRKDNPYNIQPSAQSDYCCHGSASACGCPRPWTATSGSCR